MKGVLFIDSDFFDIYFDKIPDKTVKTQNFKGYNIPVGYEYSDFVFKIKKELDTHLTASPFMVLFGKDNNLIHDNCAYFKQLQFNDDDFDYRYEYTIGLNTPSFHFGLKDLSANSKVSNIIKAYFLKKRLESNKK